MLIALLVSAVLQVLVVLAVAFVVYLVARRRARSGFLAYVGLYPPERRTLLYATGVALAFTGVMLVLFRAAHLESVATAPNTVAGRLRALGPSGAAVAALVLYAVVQTSLSEEILFRGLLAKRLIAGLGFAAGNLVQAALFGGLHLLLFAGPGVASTWARAAFIVGATGAVGWPMGAVNERRGNGSILPSWWTHALTNLVSYSVLAFGGR